jgi:hypothetical protein
MANKAVDLVDHFAVTVGVFLVQRSGYHAQRIVPAMFTVKSIQLLKHRLDDLKTDFLGQVAVNQAEMFDLVIEIFHMLIDPLADSKELTALDLCSGCGVENDASTRAIKWDLKSFDVLHFRLLEVFDPVENEVYYANTLLLCEWSRNSGGGNHLRN